MWNLGAFKRVKLVEEQPLRGLYQMPGQGYQPVAAEFLDVWHWNHTDLLVLLLSSASGQNIHYRKLAASFHKDWMFCPTYSTQRWIRKKSKSKEIKGNHL